MPMMLSAAWRDKPAPKPEGAPHQPQLIVERMRGVDLQPLVSRLSSGKSKLAFLISWLSLSARAAPNYQLIIDISLYPPC